MVASFRGAIEVDDPVACVALKAADLSDVA
jgi:hypothetical protein